MDKQPHAMIRFWKKAYGDFVVPISGGLGFHVPQFPNPLLSPNFSMSARDEFLAGNPALRHFNEICSMEEAARLPAPAGFALSKDFYLGTRRLRAHSLPAGFSIEQMKMSDAVLHEHFWALIADGFPQDASFLRALLPFLGTLDADFHTIFLLAGERKVGVVSIGIANGAALVLNEVVSSKARGKGYSKVLAELAQNHAFERGATEAFFWTEHKFFSRHADRLQRYRIFERA